MRTVLAALDSSAAATPVLQTARGIGQLMDATVAAIHVRENSAEVPTAITARAGVALRIVDGPVQASLLDALADSDVIAGVFGARGTITGNRPVGRTALHILEQSSKPVVIVPPEAVERRSFHRLLIPLEGTEQSARAVAQALGSLTTGDVELVVLHVFTPATVPPVLDHPGRDLSIWGDEFLARFCPSASRIDLSTGPVGSRVNDTCGQCAADLVVLSWSQDASPGHAAVVREVLTNSTVPTLLLPVSE